MTLDTVSIRTGSMNLPKEAPFKTNKYTARISPRIVTATVEASAGALLMGTIFGTDSIAPLAAGALTCVVITTSIELIFSIAHRRIIKKPIGHKTQSDQASCAPETVMNFETDTLKEPETENTRHLNKFQSHYLPKMKKEETEKLNLFENLYWDQEVLKLAEVSGIDPPENIVYYNLNSAYARCRFMWISCHKESPSLVLLMKASLYLKERSLNKEVSCYLEAELFINDTIFSKMRDSPHFACCKSPWIISKKLPAACEIIEKNIELINRFSNLIIKVYEPGPPNEDNAFLTSDDLLNLEILFRSLDFSDSEDLNHWIHTDEYATFKNAVLFSRELLDLIPKSPECPKNARKK